MPKQHPNAEATRDDLAAFQAAQPSSALLKPPPRVRFHWPPPSISHRWRIGPSDWAERRKIKIRDEEFELEIARTSRGLLGRVEELWLEASADTEDGLEKALQREAAPLFRRQYSISRTLGQSGRFTGRIRDLQATEILRLLYCEDRDVAAEAAKEIEIHASAGLYLPSLIQVLRDQHHPFRRSAQWAVLDLFEDFNSFDTEPSLEDDAIAAVKSLIWDAEDDYARTIYKAGVVLGGHWPTEKGGKALLECLNAPSRIGRRSAIHGLFHVVEWNPELRDTVVAALRARAEIEPEPLLKSFASGMARDIESAAIDHLAEPVFPDEP